MLHLYFASIGYLPSIHAFQPPLSTFTFVYPFFINLFATRALVSPLQEQQ
jgi:hypothetical protein